MMPGFGGAVYKNFQRFSFFRANLQEMSSIIYTRQTSPQSLNIVMFSSLFACSCHKGRLRKLTCYVPINERTIRQETASISFVLIESESLHAREITNEIVFVHL